MRLWEIYACLEKNYEPLFINFKFCAGFIQLTANETAQILLRQNVFLFFLFFLRLPLDFTSEPFLILQRTLRLKNIKSTKLIGSVELV